MTEREIFLAAIEIEDPARRMAYLHQACGTDSKLLTAVVGLLTAHAQSSQFLETPAASEAATIDQTIVTHEIPEDDHAAAERQAGEAAFRRYLEPATRPGWIGRLAHYEIEAILGSGAFGIVAKAFDEKLHRVVAIKLMNPGLATTSPPRKRFLREARTAAAVTHENLVAIHAVEEEPIPYLVMEYVPGQTLQQRMNAQGPLELKELLRIGQQVAAGLAAAHATNLIHRDIKPANILLTGGPNERAKISDFGLARAVDDASMTSSGMIAGTPLYMAPEQARGEPLDHRADLFSLGSVLYQMASGRPPFRAANTIAVLKRVCEDSPRPLTDVIPDIPGWLDTIIFKLLEKDREARYQTAQEVADLLARCQRELEHTGHVMSVPQKDGSPANRPPGSETPKPAESPPSKPESAHARHVGLGMLLALCAVLFVTVLAPRISRWFDPTIPPLPPIDTVGGLRFDGKDDYVQISSLDWRYPQFTIEAFVTSDPNSDNGTIAYLGSGLNADEEWLSLFDGGPADTGKRISGAAVHGVAGYQNAYGPFGGGARQHRALVCSGGRIDYYINGVWQGQRPAEPHEGGQWKLKELRLGCDGNGRKFFQGVIDQLRISRVARYTQSFERITSVSSDDQTLALYRFEEGHGESLKDQSGNGHDGRILGASWVKPVSSIPTEATTASWHGWPANAPAPAIAPFDAAQAKKHQEAWAAYLKVPVEYTNSLGMKFRLIPPGEFLMGSTAEEIEAALTLLLADEKLRKDCIQSEAPRHKVLLTQPFYLGVQEVTQAEYQQVMGGNPSHFASQGQGQAAVAGLNTDKHPVEMVDWHQAAEFCAKLSRREPRHPSNSQPGDATPPPDGAWYRLPSEAEWEFACRAGTVTRFWTGDHGEALTLAGWFSENSQWQTHPVGALNANPFGLSDVHGNIWEWMEDGWNANDYGRFSEEPAIDPLSPVHADSQHVVRGGAWRGPAAHGRSSSRYTYNATDRHYDIGFRVALEVDAVKAALKPQQPEVISKPGWPADAPKPAIAPFDDAQAKQHQEAWAAYLKVPVVSTNSIGAKMILIPPGEFLMGAPETDADATPQEKPQHRVRLTKPFAIGTTEITMRQFRQFVEATKYVTQAESDGQGAYEINPKVRKESNTWNHPDLKSRGGDEHPVRCVSWEDARRFCEWLTQTEGYTYRLPTEAEWEYACRAGSTTRYSFGDNHADSPSPPGMNGAPLRAVAQLTANSFGLFDMHGSVNELCLDSGRTYTAEAVTDPVGSLAIDLPAVVRGGAVSSHAARQRSSNRYLNDSRRFPETNFATITLGFRVVRDFSTPPPIAQAPFDAQQARAHQEAWAAHLKIPVEQTNSIGAKMILIPPGEFLMGSTDEQVATAHRLATEAKAMLAALQRIQLAEQPQHRVVISRPFQFGATEVTNADFRKFVEATQYVSEAEKFGFGDSGEKQLTDMVTAEQKKQTWRTPGYPITDDLPVTQVSWNDALAYCRWLSTQEQATYRLPTEAEWEYACRAGTTTDYSFGDEVQTLDQYGWSARNTQGRPEAVGAKPANGFGLHDMHGNLFEWCHDIFDETWYQHSPNRDPVGPTSGPTKEPYYVVRGGFWGSSAPLCRSAFRINHIAAYRHRSGGFRVVKEISSSPPVP